AGRARVVAGHRALRAGAGPADPRHDRVRRRVPLLRAREEPVPLDVGAGVEEELQAVADEELAFLAKLLAVLRVALLDPGPLLEVSLLACAHPTLRSRVGVAPHDDDERTVTVARPADNRGVARLRLDVGRDLGETS